MSEGLRERKQRLARQQMEQAAVEIAYTDGVHAVTVDRICAAALVSRSTFFNYFTTLEEAIFGAPLDYDPMLTDRILAEHPHDLVIAASLIVTESVRGQAENRITQRRLALFAREPGITTAVSWASAESRERLVTVIAQWLDAHREFARLPDAGSETEARLTVGMSITLGDETIRQLREVDGELQIDVASYRAVRDRLAAITAPHENG